MSLIVISIISCNNPSLSSSCFPRVLLMMTNDDDVDEDYHDDEDNVGDGDDNA